MRDKYGKVKYGKIEGMVPKLMKMAEEEMEKYEINSMGNHRGQGEKNCPTEKRSE